MATDIQTRSFPLQIKVLRAMGITFEAKDSIFYTIYSLVTLSGILLLPVFTTHAILVNLRNVDNFIEDLVFDSAFIGSFFKVVVMLFFRKRIIKIFQKLNNGVFVPNVERGGKIEQELIDECMFYINTETILLCVMSGIYAFSASLEIINRRMINGDLTYWILPFGDFSAFNTSYNPNFSIVWAYQSTYVFLGTVAYCGIDIFVMGVMAYISFQCKILQNLIKISVRRSAEKMNKEYQGKYVFALPIDPSNIEWKYLQKTLKEIVEYHMSLIHIASEFEQIFCVQILVNFLGLSVIICLALFSSTSMQSFNFRSLQQVTLACGATILQLTMAYWGNEVIVQNLAVGEACAEVDFVGTDVRFQKGLSLMIHRTQIPIMFTVGKFSPLTLGTFLTVMKAAYSYYMFLHNFE